MIYADIEQYSREWWARRLGIPTASRFGSILTEKTRKPSSSQVGLVADLLVERESGRPSDYREGLDDEQLYGYERDGTPWMKRGSEVEDEARRWYGLQTGRRLVEVGFVTHETEEAGCSPDGLVLRGGVDPVGELPNDAIVRGAEIKCRSAKHHKRILLGDEAIADVTQVQGSMWVTGASVWDAVAYCPGQPGRIVTCYRDPSWMAAWDSAWSLFRGRMKDAEEAIARIEGDVQLDSNLAEVFDRAFKKKATKPCPFTGPELSEFRQGVERALALDIMDANDVLAIVNDLWAEDWDSVGGMVEYVERALETTVKGGA